MAHSLARALSFAIVTADRRKPAIRSFLFDDRSRLIRYVVADLGRRFSPRLVAVPVALLRGPDWPRGILETELSLEELSHGPDADAVRPVSRQRQLAWNRHFGWSDQGSGYQGSSVPVFPRREFHDADSSDDPNLRATTDLISYQVWGSGGCLGLLEDFFVEDRSWRIGCLLVRAGSWIFHEKLVPNSSVTAISWEQGRVEVDRPAHAC